MSAFTERRISLIIKRISLLGLTPTFGLPRNGGTHLSRSVFFQFLSCAIISTAMKTVGLYFNCFFSGCLHPIGCTFCHFRIQLDAFSSILFLFYKLLSSLHTKNTLACFPRKGICLPIRVPHQVGLTTTSD